MFSKSLSQFTKQKPDRNEEIEDFPCFDSKDDFLERFYKLASTAEVCRERKKKKKAEGSLVFFLYIRNCAIEGKIYHLTRATSAFRVNFPDVISDALYFARKEFGDKCPQESRRKIKILFCIAREDEALVYERKLITNRHLDHDS